ncbi:putative nucleotidyltransferase with HDIG domain [Dyadobacter jejuensis]|uniref:Putative nucleotidyltransferase with HDIG domain n=1 Tax=Dyadobacter jejuensis TaxID=1082580 RepID=A0A316B442_9BACT|nr:HD domain-containing protein [Dyadobacter jejuensis]PWJ57347.1 putative nucleotidyltransferase with HDIG domain [Dyadobacter jejuensis]
MNFKEELTEYPILSSVLEASEGLGEQVYLIGGFVRDLILKRPSKDIDIVTVGSGIALAERVAALLGPQVQVHIFKNFGTAQIKQGDLELEFVGARRESYQSDSRKPAVEDGSLQDDQNRRDFTINAMGISLNKKDFGELVDPFDGLRDLRKRIIRTPLEPGITFSDDPLRMMRAIRFATQLNFDIEPDTFEAIMAMKDRISIVSMERISDELNKIILAKTPSYGFKLLYHSGLLGIIFPEMIELQGVENIEGKGHKDNFYHTLQVLDNVSETTDDLWLRWAAILHDIAKPATKKFDKKVGWTFHNHEEVGARMVPTIFRRMKLPLNEKMRFVKKLVRLHLRPIVLTKDNITDAAMRRLLVEAGEDIEDLMKLCRADITSKNPLKVKKYVQNFDLVEQKLKDLEERDKLRNFQPVITGAQIMEAFGLKPTREVGEIKEAVREAILEGLIPNELEPAYAYMLKIGAEMGIKPIA